MHRKCVHNAHKSGRLPSFFRRDEQDMSDESRMFRITKYHQTDKNYLLQSLNQGKLQVFMKNPGEKAGKRLC